MLSNRFYTQKCEFYCIKGVLYRKLCIFTLDSPSRCIHLMKIHLYANLQKMVQKWSRQPLRPLAIESVKAEIAIKFYRQKVTEGKHFTVNRFWKAGVTQDTFLQVIRRMESSQPNEQAMGGRRPWKLRLLWTLLYLSMPKLTAGPF